MIDSLQNSLTYQKFTLAEDCNFQNISIKSTDIHSCNQGGDLSESP